MTVETQLQSNLSVKLAFRNLGKTFFVQGEPKLALLNISAEIKTGDMSARALALAAGA